MTVNAGKEIAKKLSQIGKDADRIAKKVVMAGADPVADEIRKNLEKNLEGSKYSQGNLLDSFGIAPVSVDKNGNINTKIGFAGYDSKGVPNAIKARAMESGTSTQPKKPFMRPALNKTRQKAKEAMTAKFDEEVKIYAL